MARYQKPREKFRAMAFCPACNNRRLRLRQGVLVPCDQCQGMEPSCCDGPVGQPDEQPTDPSARRSEDAKRPRQS
jgi:hypothetical protein